MTGPKASVPAPPKAEPPPTKAALPIIGYWGVVLGWMAVISLMSTEPFSASNTNRYIDPLLRFFFPSLRRADFVFAHTVIRKTAHFVEFFILGSLLYWACRRGRWPAWRASWMAQALVVAVLYSLIDEFHQAFVPNRTPSLFDSGVDSLGVVVSQAYIYLRHVMLRRISLLR
jgi:VanZ family protein